MDSDDRHRRWLTQFFRKLKDTARQRGAWQGEIELKRRNGGTLPVWRVPLCMVLSRLSSPSENVS